jgi:alpha/beta superfamily hydrolase
VEFVGGSGVGVLTSSHIPNGEIRAGLIVCPGLFNDLAKNHRRETLLARALADRGIAALRFDYRGTGNSGADGFEATFESMVDDARRAAEHLTERARLDEVAFLGTRVGALVAAAAVERGDTPLALWEPVVDIDRYFRDCFRARLMSELKRATSRDDKREDLLSVMQREGSVDVLGYPVRANLYESLRGRTVAGESGQHARPFLLVQFSRRPALRSEYEQLVAALESRGASVSARVFEREESWWFNEDVRRVEDTATEARALLEMTTEWLDRQLRARQAA